jgi:hypothetical protein
MLLHGLCYGCYAQQYSLVRAFEAQAAKWLGPATQETPMKKSDLDRNEGLKITGQMKQAGTPDRFGSAANMGVSRRDQRKLDQAQGLIPFAVKLDGELVKQIHALAQANGTDINETVAALISKGLAG